MISFTTRRTANLQIRLFNYRLLRTTQTNFLLDY